MTALVSVKGEMLMGGTAVLYVSLSLFSLWAGPLPATDLLGKIVVRAAAADAQGFLDATLEDSVKDIVKNLAKDKFTVVASEADADFLLVVTERKTEPRQNRFTGSATVGPHVYATLSVKADGAWKPGIKVRSGSDSWGSAAKGVIKQVEAWIKERPGK